MKRNKGMIVAFLTPALIFFVLIFVYPIIRTVIMSFFKVESVTADPSLWIFTGIENYAKLFSTQLFMTSMWNLARIWAVGGIVVMSIALLFAVILNSGIRFKRFFRAVIYMPNIISAVALATMWLQYVYSPQFGMLKNFFTKLGLDGLASIQWLDADHKFWA
ncbi:MAG: sugar ABC transporter permease, partial [Clostridia bacterium]